MPRGIGLRLGCAFLLALWAPGLRADSVEPPRDLTRLTLAELANVEVTTVSRRPEKIGSAGAAVFVITNEDLRRLGIATLAEALRLAPGVQVSRINSNQWSVGIRGFASGLSRAVLILLDGRSTYTTLFAGTYWDVLDTLLEDVDRIEIIRGPGGTLWGANAVNGVVNIITKSASETQGGYAEAVGTGLHGILGGRWGGRDGATSFRVYGKYADRGPSFHPDGDDYDAWRVTQGGFRADVEASSRDRLTVQGDVYQGRIGERTLVTSYEPPYGQTVHFDAPVSGGNVLARWERSDGPDTALAVQAYFDRTLRTEAVFADTRNTGDLDVQYRFRTGGHEIVSGLQGRVSTGATTGVPSVVFTPERKTDRILGVFAQDTVSLFADHVKVTAGIKIEHNDYSGTEIQPQLSLFAAFDERQNVWASVSRAVRAPSRVDTDLSITQVLAAGPVYYRLTGDESFKAEETLAYQVGYRLRPAEALSFDLSLFYNRYDNLESFERGTIGPAPPTPGLVFPVRYENMLEGSGFGGELVVGVQVARTLRIQASYSRLQLDLRARPGSTDVGTAAYTEGSSPRENVTLRGSLDLPGRVTFDAFLRGAGPLPAQQTPGYVTLDARLAWSPGHPLEVALVGKSLLQDHHLEFAGGPASAEVPRSVFGEVKLRW
ncbi:MAG: TonB-dependent receptor [Acidobacteriota bacterium]